MLQVSGSQYTEQCQASWWYLKKYSGLEDAEWLNMSRYLLF